MSEMDLSGVWEIRHDPGDEGLRGRWFENPPEDGWMETRVPGAWQHTLGADARGVAWYLREVEVPPEWLRADSRVWLRFDAAATDCTAWVNGEEVGRHVGDYLPFQFEVTRALRGRGRASLVVRVDQMHAPRPAPGVLTENGHITKGFHDVLSLQHAGLWGEVSLVRTGRVAARHRGACVVCEGERVVVRVALDAHDRGGAVRCVLRDPAGAAGARGSEVFEAGAAEVELRLSARGLPCWSPGAPVLCAADVVIEVDGAECERLTLRFGVRSVRTGGAGNRLVLLNGEPVLLRGVLHWGHEPEHIAPAPTPQQVRAEFARLKAMGFNCVCLCMWYAPEWFYDIADETGMLLWQEHPVWKSPMGEEHVPEYQRLFEGFFRRDARHPSVVLVSATCEHESFNPELAEWWWERSARALPGTLRQVQTGFIAWSKAEHTDLYDEHVYDNSGRWTHFVEDLRATLETLPPKPFVMGETIIGASWLDTAAFQAAEPGREAPWWYPKGLAACRELGARIAREHGEDTLARFRRQGDEANLATRKFQVEVLRSFDRCAGFVTNQIRDVPPARLGFMDDLGRWRFAPEQTRPFMGDRALLLKPDGWLFGVEGGRAARMCVGLSNFAGTDFAGEVLVSVEGAGPKREKRKVALRCERGCVAWGEIGVAVPAAQGPRAIVLRASAQGAAENAWRLWAFPTPQDLPPDTVRLDGLPFSARDAEMEFEERSYSSGWGLKNLSWRPVLPDLSRLLFRMPLWRFDAPMPLGTRCVVTHALTERVVDFMAGGGSVLLLASRVAGGMGARTVMLWGQTPLVVEGTVLEAGESAWVVDLLHHDLTRRHARAVPTDEMGIAGEVSPVVRLVYTHDSGAPRLFDAVFAARVGRGVLVVSSLDHCEVAGRHLLHRLVAFAHAGAPGVAAVLEPERVRRWTDGRG